MVPNRDRCTASVHSGRNFHAASWGLKPDRIAQHVVDGAPEKFQIAIDAKIENVGRGNRHSRGVRFELGIFDDFVQEQSKFHALANKCRHRARETRELQRFPDQRVQAFNVPFYTLN
jgi:hypothetical protein